MSKKLKIKWIKGSIRILIKDGETDVWFAAVIPESEGRNAWKHLDMLVILDLEKDHFSFLEIPFILLVANTETLAIRFVNYF